MSQPPPRAPTFPKFVNEADDSSYLKTPAQPTNLPDMDDRDFSTPQTTQNDVNRDAPPSPGTPPHEDDSAHIPAVDLPVAGNPKGIVASILLWRDPKVTAVYFGTALAFFYLTLILGKSVLSVFGMIIAIYQLLGMIGVVLNKKLGGKFDNHIRRPEAGTPLFKRVAAHHWADVIVDEGNDIQDILRDIMYCDKPATAIKVLCIGICIYFIGQLFSMLPLFFLVVMGLFSIPLAYEKNKKQVDETIAKASDTVVRQVSLGQQMASDKTAELLDKAPPAAREFAEKVGLTPKKKVS